VRARPAAGFTLLEVLVALTIVAVAVVSLLELSAQGLRLLKLSSDHQRAVELADRIARETEVSEEMVEAGEDAHFTWERRVALVPLPDELEPTQSQPGREAPPLFAVTVLVRWGRNQGIELATLRAPSPVAPPEAVEADGDAAAPRGADQRGGDEPGAAGRPGTAAPGAGPSAPAPAGPRAPGTRQPARGGAR
jgi:general secretion pathway protein I